MEAHERDPSELLTWEEVQGHLRFRPEVVADLPSAAKWYDSRSPGLGAAFLGECKSALDNIADNPEQVSADTSGLRSRRFHRPYVVHYRIEHSTVVIFAVMFGGPDPSAWSGRV